MAQKVLDQLNDLSKRKYVPARFRAVIYVGLKEKDKAFEWLRSRLPPEGFKWLGYFD
jgi:hypothetical protein